MSDETAQIRADRAAYAAAVRAVFHVPDAELQAGFERARLRVLPRGAFFLHQGETASDVALVVSGLLREYFVMKDGSERTKAFVAERQLTGSLADLLAGGPSRATIVADEPCRLLVTSYGGMRALARENEAWRRFGIRVLERLLLVKAQREYELLGLSADERYAVFAERYPGLEARVAGKHIASYLGITPVHLSRLRRRRARRGVP